MTVWVATTSVSTGTLLVLLRLLLVVVLVVVGNTNRITSFT